MNFIDERIAYKVSFKNNSYQIKIRNSEEIQRRESNRVQLFQRTKSRSGSKNYLNFQLIKNTNSNNNNNQNIQSMRKKSLSIYDFNNNSEEINIKEIYKNNDDNNDVPKYIKIMKIKMFQK